jgi:hypothetical protein
MFLQGKRGKPKDRRRAARALAPALTAFYWTGGVSHPCSVRDISLRGAYIETKTDWYAGTVLHLVLERNPSGERPAEAAKTSGLWARVVRTDPHGMGMEFLMRNREEEREFNRFLETTIEDLV